MSQSTSRTGIARQRVGLWLFAEPGLAAAWVALVLVAGTAWLKIVRTQNEVTQGALLVLGLWWLAGIVVAQWLIPQGTDTDRAVEGLAAAGWHAALAVCSTGLMVWDTFFVNGEYVNRGLNGGTMALSSWLIGTVSAAMLVIWLRGHSLWHTVKYAMIGTAAGGAWMALGLMLAVP